jgi:hypothetical protein
MYICITDICCCCFSSSGYGKGGMLRGKCESSHLNRLQFVDPSSLILKNKKLLDDSKLITD